MNDLGADASRRGGVRLTGLMATVTAGLPATAFADNSQAGSSLPSRKHRNEGNEHNHH